MDLSKIIQEVNQFNNSDVDSGKNEYKSTNLLELKKIKV